MSTFGEQLRDEITASFQRSSVRNAGAEGEVSAFLLASEALSHTIISSMAKDASIMMRLDQQAMSFVVEDLLAPARSLLDATGTLVRGDAVRLLQGTAQNRLRIMERMLRQLHDDLKRGTPREGLLTRGANYYRIFATLWNSGGTQEAVTDPDEAAREWFNRIATNLQLYM